MTPEDLDALRADWRTQAANRIAELNAPSPEPSLPAGNPFKGSVKNPSAAAAYFRGNTVDPAKTQSMVRMGVNAQLANDVEQIRRASNSGLRGLPKLGETLAAPGNRAGYVQSLAGNKNYMMPNFVEPPLKALPASVQGPPEAAGPRMPPGQKYMEPIGPTDPYGNRLGLRLTQPPPTPASPTSGFGPKLVQPLTSANMDWSRLNTPVPPPRPASTVGTIMATASGPIKPIPTYADTSMAGDLRAIGGSLGNAFERAKGVGAAVMRNPTVNNPLTRTLGRASGPLGSALMVKGAWDEMSDPTSRANQHNALYNQALEEGRYGDAASEGAMSVANTVGAATGLRSIYDFFAGNGAQAAPAAKAQTPQLPTFAQAAQHERYMHGAGDETPAMGDVRVRYGNNGREYNYSQNAQTGRYDETTPEQVAAATAARSKMAIRAIDAQGKVRAAEAANRTPLSDYKRGIMDRFAQLTAARLKDPENPALKAEWDMLQQYSLQLQALEKPHNAVQTLNLGGSSNGDEL